MNAKEPTEQDVIPPSKDWQGPMCWAGSPPRPVTIYSRPCPPNTVFVRAEVIFTVSEEISPGVTRQSETAVPGLIRLDRGQPVEVHAPGLDGQCWTYRRMKAGKHRPWTLFTGAAFPAETQGQTGAGHGCVERVLVQSILPMAGNRHISLMFDSSGRAEDLAAATDPDPED